jgi:hypothetical protein
MPNGTTAEQPIELISTTVEELLASLGSGIGRAQAELDRHSIEIQKQILEDPVRIPKHQLKILRLCPQARRRGLYHECGPSL